jgi:hypothetical protein
MTDGGYNPNGMIEVNKRKTMSEPQKPTPPDIVRLMEGDVSIPPRKTPTVFVAVLHYLDSDIPVAVFETDCAAREYIATAPEQLGDELRAIWDTDVTHSLGYSVVEFSGTTCLRREVVRWFDDAKGTEQ